MEEDLAQHGVSVIALSKDDEARSAMHKRRDDIHFPMLSDPLLRVIRQYGLEHHKALEFSTGRFMLLGIPLALVPSVQIMAIPTSLLIDEAGEIRWIDQSDDYRLRSDPGRVLEAIREIFPLERETSS